jgi:hypothetical protein
VKLEYDEPLSSFAFNLTMRRYSAVFQQAENRMHAQNAIMLDLLGC